jgi:hypothetical protein
MLEEKQLTNARTLPDVADDFLGPALPKLPTAQQSDFK